jgi:Uma2 family endonuclease
MATAQSVQYISIEDYLAGELESQVKHEYLGGVVYAMAGARVVHNMIMMNLYGALHSQLRGKKCRPFSSDMKIRVQLPTQTRFYYPDASVICKSNPPMDSFQDQPSLIAEVISRSTRRIDEGEKKDAYQTIPSLSTYLLIEQDNSFVTVFRRTEQGFVRETYRGLDASIPLAELDAELLLADLYEGVEFQPEPAEELE